jgi:hypothetical protein
MLRREYFGRISYFLINHDSITCRLSRLSTFRQSVGGQFEYCVHLHLKLILWSSDGGERVRSAILIIPFSVATFVASGLSSDIRTDIVTGNDLAVKLTLQLGPLPAATQPFASIVTGASPPAASTASPPKAQSDQITELQQFASTIRAIDARARQLNFLLLPAAEKCRGGVLYTTTQERRAGKIFIFCGIKPGHF